MSLKRAAGILYPIFSLPSRFGIGSISQEAFDFVDFLKAAGQSAWQILPVGPTGFGNSPYQPLSAFAGNPYFISPEKLIEEELLTWDECNAVDFGQNPEKVDYGKIYAGRRALLRTAFAHFKEQGGLGSPAFVQYAKEQADWLDDYALFCALKEHFDGASWVDWEDAYRERDAKVLDMAALELQEEVNFYRFQQFLFDRQWTALHEYAAKNGIQIIGDIPFYVSLDSADAWSHPEVFRMTPQHIPEVIAGCPPDAFSATGQLWGNPIYDWRTQKKKKYPWWIRRMARCMALFDVIRIDHFHGFCSYYAVPYGDETAENGTLEKGPGMDFFRVLRAELGEVPIIAEDLGNVTAENRKLLEDTGFPGMKILQFAFTSWNSVYLPFRHIRNCVVYTGTHDNPTTREWIEKIPDGSRDYARRYIHSENTDYGAFTWDFIREAYRSVADLCIIPIQDYLVKGREARINTPGQADGNWEWRILPHFLSDDLARSIRGLAELYGRLPAEN